MKRAVFIINPISGTYPKDLVEKAIISNIDKSIEATIIYSRYRGHAGELARYYSDKSDFLVAVGGDGSVNEVGSALVGTGVPMGIIPVGSGNGLARHLGIPLKVSKAISIINENITRSIDVIKVNEYYSFNVAGVGFDALISQKATESKSRGQLQYVRLVTKEFADYRPLKYQIKFDNGKVINRKAFIVSFANSSQWGNNFYIAPRAKIDDGLIDMCIISEFPKYEILSLLLSLLDKTIDRGKYDEIYKIKNIELLSENDMIGHIDGESILFGRKVNISIQPLSAKIIVPSKEYFKPQLISKLQDNKLISSLKKYM